MPSTFFGLNIASSGLSAYQVALNTTANNIANVQTTGYSRQQSNRVASDALLVHQQYGAVGTGVTTVSVKQIRNQYYDTKYWYNQSCLLYTSHLPADRCKSPLCTALFRFWRTVPAAEAACRNRSHSCLHPEFWCSHLMLRSSRPPVSHPAL